ncbi:MAG TPA: DUF6049 family protein [Jatrophihabitans sp.]|nr:DUF6049 family protein [Jatrophihabitans sp.]
MNRRQTFVARRPRLPRLAAGLATLVLLAIGLLPVTPARAEAARAQPAVRMSVVSVTPTSPALSQTPKPLVVVLTVTNLTATRLAGLKIEAVRGDPIGSQQALDKSLAKAPWPSDGLPITPTKPVTVSLAAHASATVSFRTNTDIPEDAGICLCHQAVYPLFFGAFGKSDHARLGFTHTYLPVFKFAPKPVRVAWVWPLIDRPHRTTSETVFTDDTLADLVSSGGRLDKSLTVLEQVGRRGVPITLLADPDLLDELVVMSTRPYVVQPTPTAPRTPGIGSVAAAAWLDRLRALLTDHPNVSVRLTPYADPDVQTLAQRQLTWAPQLAGTAMTIRVQDALAGRPLVYDTAWPAGGALSPDALRKLQADRVRTLLLDAAAVRQQTESSVPAGLARLGTAKSPVAAALLSQPMQRYATAVLNNTRGTGLAQLPNLAAEIAVQAAQEPNVEHEVVLAAPRSVDPDPATAYRAIMDTTHAPYIAAAALPTVTAPSRLPSTAARLAKIPADAVQLPEPILATANEATTALPTLNSLLGADPRAKTNVLAGLPLGVQRSVSTAWRTQRSAGVAAANQLSTTFSALLGGVKIVRPTSGSYTLGSSNSTLPITVQNELAYQVRVQVQVATVNDVPGFAYTDIGTQTIQARTKRTLHLPTEISRTGRIAIEAQLLTPDAQPIGANVQLTVHSTALGIVGVVITIVAGAVLIIALVLRFARRLRHRERPVTPTPSEPLDSDPVGTGPTR